MDIHNEPMVIWVPRTLLQNAATTIHTLALSKYLTHFPCISPEDIGYARRIVENITSNTNSTTRTFAPTVFASMSSTSSEEYDAYAALQNGVTASAVIAHWRVVKAYRELNTPIQLVKGAEDCGNLWKALEKCWGAGIVDEAKAEAGLAAKGRGGGGGN